MIERFDKSSRILISFTIVEIFKWNQRNIFNLTLTEHHFELDKVHSKWTFRIINTNVYLFCFGHVGLNLLFHCPLLLKSKVSSLLSFFPIPFHIYNSFKYILSCHVFTILIDSAPTQSEHRVTMTNFNFTRSIRVVIFKAQV